MAMKRLVSREVALRGHVRKVNEAILERIVDGRKATAEQSAKRAALVARIAEVKAGKGK